MDKAINNIGGLQLPLTLLQAIKEGRWSVPDNNELLKRVFGDEPDWPEFFDLPTMLRQNQFFQSKTPAEFEEEITSSRLGLRVDPHLAVLIGALGADMPIALDYRKSRHAPRVIYLARAGWREVARSFDALCKRLNL